LIAALLLLLSPPAGAAAPAPRDWLWHIVSECVEPSAADYCDRCQRPIDGLCGEKPCAESIALWGMAEGLVAVRDRKMCGCPSPFVHGLVLPLQRVTGVEDPARPDGLWAFAWKQALGVIETSDDILLAVNGPQRRTQDQLHAHIMRLMPSGRKKLLETGPERVASLDEAWRAAARHAKRLGAEGWYGVAVIRADAKSYWVAAEPAGHPETSFGQPHCR
jgi:CDP-diacylglycerol pyrophosphatase